MVRLGAQMTFRVHPYWRVGLLKLSAFTCFVRVEKQVVSDSGSDNVYTDEGKVSWNSACS